MAADAGSQTAAVRAASAENEQATLEARVVKSTALPAAFQQAMEAGDRRAAIQACGAACAQPPGGRITAGGDSPRYTCNSGNCACAGAADCVAMAPICEDGTIGCNDYGCTCKEGEGD